MGGSFGKNESSSNFSQTAGQDVWSGQSPWLQQMYGYGANLMNQPGFNMGAAQGQAIGQGQQIFNPMMDYFQSTFGPGSAMGQAAAGAVNPLLSGLTNMLGAPPPSFAEGGVNPLLDQNVAMALEQASQNFQRNVLPGIDTDAAKMGQFSGTKKDIAQGLAMSDLNKQALQAASGAYQNQYAQDRAANLLSQQMWGQNQNQAMGLINSLLTGQQQGAGMGVGAGMGLMNLGMGGYGQAMGLPWQGAYNMANILGDPTILGSMSSTGSADSSGWGGGFSLFG